MERLLAKLLGEADEREELKILSLHQRLKALYENQSGLRKTRQYLLQLTEQIE